MRFTATEMHMLHGCFRALLPPEALELPLVGFQIWVERVAPARAAWGLRGVLLYLRLRCLMGGRPWGRRRVTEHRALFEEMRTSPLYLVREMPVMLKALGAFAAFGHPDTQRAFGLPADETPPFWARPGQRWERRGTGSGGVRPLGGADPAQRDGGARPLGGADPAQRDGGAGPLGGADPAQRDGGAEQ